MTAIGLLQFVFYLAVLAAMALPLGLFMARVYDGRRHFLSPLCDPVERRVYRLIGVDPNAQMTWKSYSSAVLVFHALGFLALFLLMRIQGRLPVNPAELPGVGSARSFNAAISFMTNTNWQSYGGETTMSYLTQMAGLAVQNFLSAAAGMAVLVVLIRGLRSRQATELGNFWVDLTRSIVHILLPLALILAVALVSQGVVQSFAPPVETATQTLPLGPAASQIAIKQLGTNGGGLFNVNSAHPFENPTPLSNLLEMLAILLIPAALCITFGKMVGQMRQGYALLAAMTLVFVVCVLGAGMAEYRASPSYPSVVDQTSGNMEGKEVRFGVANSVIWGIATTAASNGSVNSMHDSWSPLGGLLPLGLIQLGEVIFGGVGSGLYGMIIFVLFAVFIAGLMVGRTPEYLGKKIEAFEMKMASLAILLPSAAILLGTALAVGTDAGPASMNNPGARGFSEALYAFSSAGGNNGSAFAGFNANTNFFNVLLGIGMLVGRFGVMLPVLAIAGSLAEKKLVPPSAGTLATHTPLFVALLLGTLLLLGALTFIPALALGPIVEHLQLYQLYR